MALVDVVVVSFNSRLHLRACVEALSDSEGVNVIVVDNASTDRSLDAIGDLRVTAVALEKNVGFAAGCNVGWRLGRSPFVLFLNPDAVIDADALARLTQVLERNPDVAGAAPRILDPEGRLEYSLRRFPRLRSTYARAVFLHRLLPRVSWTDEVIRDERLYSRAHSPEWVSGACILVRREVLEKLGGFDEAFFMYGEDKDFCRRVRTAGFTIRYEPDAVCVHEGGASVPRAELLPTLAASRLIYAKKHFGRSAAMFERVGVALSALAHTLVARSAAARVGHARSLQVVATRRYGTLTPMRGPQPDRKRGNNLAEQTSAQERRLG